MYNFGRCKTVKRFVSQYFRRQGSMRYTYYGHSSFMIETAGQKIIFDPYISPNDKAKSIDVNNISCNYILLSHGHFDHVHDVETIALNCNATVVASYELATYYGEKKLKYHPMNIGGRWDFGSFQVKAMNALHSSGLPDGTYAGSPMGYIVSSSEGSFYYSGDTALTLDMQLIGSYQKIDRAFLCLGDNFTMGLDDAIVASDFIKCNHITGMHFDTFPYIRIDHQKAIEKFGKAGKTLVLPEIGKTYDL